VLSLHFVFCYPITVFARLARGSGGHPCQVASYAVGAWMGYRLAAHCPVPQPLSGRLILPTLRDFFTMLECKNNGDSVEYDRLYWHRFSAVFPCPRQMRYSAAKTAADAPEWLSKLVIETRKKSVPTRQGIRKERTRNTHYLPT